MNQKTLLHVDDDPIFRRALRRVFERAGWEVLEAEHGEEGCRRAKEGIACVILLDIRMPIQDGFQTLRLLKADTDTREIPVVMCSSLGSKEDVQFCLDAGACGYLVKAHHQPEEMQLYVEHVLAAL